LDDEWRDLLRKLIYYDKESSSWQGWYARLFERSGPNSIFSYDIWIKKLIASPPNDKINFQGGIIYNTLRFPQIGFVVVKDKFEKQYKLMLYVTYDAREVYKKFEERIGFKDVWQSILDRL
jgi:hypothetical protein